MSRPIAHADDVSEDLFAPDRKAVIDNGLVHGPRPEFINSYAEASQAYGGRRGPMPLDMPSKQGDSENKNHLDRNEDAVADTTVANITQVGLKTSSARKMKAERNKAPSRAPKVSTSARMMTVEDVAAYLSVSVSKIWRICRKEPAFPKPRRIGGSTRWDRTDIDLYLDRLSSSTHAGR